MDNSNILAHNLGLSREEFSRLLNSANYAYEIIKNLGPFYGQSGMQEPTFRIAAEPIPIPKKYKEALLQFGNDLLYLGKTLSKLPKQYKDMLGENLDYRLPPTWRLDTILDAKGNMRINEIEGVDGASALMIAEQLAYKLQELPQSTAALLISTLRAYTLSSGVFKIALIWPNIETDPYIPNIQRFTKFLFDLSEKTLRVELFDEAQLKQHAVKPDWSKFGGVINESALTLKELKKLGIKDTQLISAGFYNVIVNKGLFALVYEPKLKDFWTQEIGKERLERIQKILIPTRFIKSVADLEEARKSGKVVKVSWADGNMALMDRSKGVAIPDGQIKHNSEERWESLKQLVKQGVRLIAQDYVKPAKIHAYLRKKGTNLEEVEWYNRICVKYVSKGNPNIKEIPEVDITAVEVTLGPDVVPAGRQCAFTAGQFVD